MRILAYNVWCYCIIFKLWNKKIFILILSAFCGDITTSPRAESWAGALLKSAHARERSSAWEHLWWEQTYTSILHVVVSSLKSNYPQLRGRCFRPKDPLRVRFTSFLAQVTAVKFLSPRAIWKTFTMSLYILRSWKKRYCSRKLSVLTTESFLLGIISTYTAACCKLSGIINLASVELMTSSSENSGLISFKTKPSGVTSITARSVTIKSTSLPWKEKGWKG